jgi:PAS domain S-box-containing protein
MDFAKNRVTRSLVVLALAFIPASAVAQRSATNPRVLRVVMDNDYPPYSFQSDGGKLQGILIDQWRLWEKKTGIKAEIRAMDWAEALRRTRAGEFDVIDCIVATDDRREYFDFTPAYAQIEAAIFFRHEISAITDLDALRGFPVGVKTGDQHIDKLSGRGVTALVRFRNNGDIVRAAKQHQINVFVMDTPSALYLLSRNGLSRDFRRSAPMFRDTLRRAVRKGDTETLNVVSKGFAAIGADELERIDEEWFGRTINWYELHFIYAAYAAAAVLVLISGLAVWNRALRKRVLQRTSALAESEQRFRQIAENVKQAEDRVRLIINTIPAMVWSLGPDGVVDFVNQRWLDYTGLSFEEAMRDPNVIVHPEDLPRIMKKWLVDMAAGKLCEYEMRFRRADGENHWFLVRTVPLLDGDGQIIKWYGSSTDIEDRKRAEEKLKRSESQLAEAQRISHVGHWERNADGGEVICSEETYRIFGLPAQDAIRNLEEMIHPDDRPLHAAAIARALQGEPFDVEYRVVRPDGEVRFVHSQGRAIQDQPGRPHRTFGAVQDVTEVKRAEEKLKATSEHLRALSARLHSAREEEGIRIAREIHDELGATLTSLRWELESIKKTLSEPGAIVPAAELKAKFITMFGVIDTMVNIVRGIASDLRPVVLDVLGLEEAIEWHGQQFQDRTGITVDYRPPDDEVELQPDQSIAVFRIFQETLTNILRHAGATRVDVTMARGAAAFVLSVSDNGRGITESEKDGQMSIGLLGMRERAHLLGGEVEITGVEGEGTTVTVRFPV